MNISLQSDYRHIPVLEQCFDEKLRYNFASFAALREIVSRKAAKDARKSKGFGVHIATND
ncbi:MAG: hypothetical protein ABIP78_11950 [Pyrinomonadaceae bacterium]